VNAPLDDKALDEYLSRGSDVSRRYRELDDDNVPPELDRRVLAEAHGAVSKNQSGGRAWMRWSAPLALAASAVLVLSIVIESGGDYERPMGMTDPDQAADARPAKAETSAPKAASTPAEPPVEVFTGLVPDATFEPQAPPEVRAPAAASQSREQTLARQSAERQRVRGLVGETDTQARTEEVQVTAGRAAPAVEMTSPTPIHTITEDEVLQEAVVTGQRRAETRRSSGPRDTIARPSASGVSANAEAEYADRAFKRSTPEEWLEEIRRLRREGEAREADTQWEQFRKQFPDYPVAEDDIAVKRP
jgi:hypothetical protein